MNKGLNIFFSTFAWRDSLFFSDFRSIFLESMFPEDVLGFLTNSLFNLVNVEEEADLTFPQFKKELSVLKKKTLRMDTEE